MNLIVIGAGIMGVTFAKLAKEMAPDLKITILERLDDVASGNTHVFNNAGTGHEANCELNYTPVDEEVISVEKALKIHAQFNVAKQFWAYLVKQGVIKEPSTFIQQTKHCTLVKSDAIGELKLRYKEMSAHHFFEHMHYSNKHDQIKEWIPYTMENRPASDKVAATMIDYGSDVNFESLTKQLADHLVKDLDVEIAHRTHVRHVHRSPTGRWVIEASQYGEPIQYKADILFVGAGGGAFPLLKKSHLPCRTRYAGFPVGGRFLQAKITAEEAKLYSAKTYGKAKVGAPPMSVPHLDLRAVNGEHYLLFGPFATFTPILEKNRGIIDYVRSIRSHDIPNLLNVAREHFSLVKYLFSETFKGRASMLEELEDFAPGLSKKFDWQVIQAGQRVQIIKDGDLQMGTEIVVSEDKTYGTLLGASPGASVSPEVMLRCIDTLMPNITGSEHAQSVRKEMFPVDDLDTLINDAELYRSTRKEANTLLGIGSPE